MAQKKTLTEILALDCPDLVNELYDFISEKRRTRQVLLLIEEEIYLSLSMLLDIEMEGFVDLFHQFYTLHETYVVEAMLKKLGLRRLAELFSEARSIFTNGRVELTEEEYKAINPFGDDERWQRFYEIGNEILAEGSEIFSWQTVFVLTQRNVSLISRHEDTELYFLASSSPPNTACSEYIRHSMDLICEERLSDAPFVERVWRSQGERAGPFISIAETEYALVVTKYRGKTTITLRGPTTRATPAFCPPDAEFFGIQFKPGVFIPNLPPKMVRNRQDINLPEASSRSFCLNGSAWQYPNYENADTFVNRLVRAGLLVYDSIIATVLQGQLVDTSLRTVQRRFLRATGLTHNTIYQIHRAQDATTLLNQGTSILDTVHQAGYFDQPHLTRSLKHFIGLTPAQIVDQGREERLSFLYKKNPPWLHYNTNVLKQRT